MEEHRPLVEEDAVVEFDDLVGDRHGEAEVLGGCRLQLRLDYQGCAYTPLDRPREVDDVGPRQRRGGVPIC
jgi:hypothetical protein